MKESEVKKLEKQQESLFIAYSVILSEPLFHQVIEEICKENAWQMIDTFKKRINKLSCGPLTTSEILKDGMTLMIEMKKVHIDYAISDVVVLKTRTASSQDWLFVEALLDRNEPIVCYGIEKDGNRIQLSKD
jgi:hypothetical protein